MHTQKILGEQFYCRRRRRQVNLAKCLEDYVNSNAFENTRRACFRCPEGRMNREAFAEWDGDEETAPPVYRSSRSRGRMRAC